MSYRLRQSMSDDGGFTLIELLVVILIIGILAAIAIPALLSQKSKAYDSSAKTLAQTSQTAMETWSTENGGSYEGGTPVKLNSIEPSINAVGAPGANATEAELISTSTPSSTEYSLTVKAKNTGDEYTVTRKTNGTVEHTCVSKTKGCPGQTSTATSW